MDKINDTSSFKGTHIFAECYDIDYHFLNNEELLVKQLINSVEKSEDVI